MVRSSFVTVWTAAILASGIVLIVATAAPNAQRRRTDNASEGVPVATNRILQNPDAYFGKRVTVSASVEQVLSGTAFVVDQRKLTGPTTVVPIGKPILVIAPYLKTALAPQDYLLVRGQLVKFTLEALARLEPGYALDVAPEIGAKYSGQPVLVALSIRDAAFTEIAAKPIAPPTPEEVSMTAVMKTIGSSFSMLENAAEAKQAEMVTQQAVKLQPAFAEVAGIWGVVEQPAAAELARAAREHAATIERAVAAGDWPTAGSAVAALNQSCESCHRTHRQAQDDGTFRFVRMNQ